MDKDYIILRKGGDIDCLLMKEKTNVVREEFIKKGFILEKRRWKTFHAKKIFQNCLDYHFYVGGIPYNNINLFDQKYFFKENKISELIALMLHLILDKESINGKRGKEFYDWFRKLSKKEKRKFFEILEKEYCSKITRKIKKITEKKEINIKKLKWQIILKKANLFQIIGMPFVLVSNQIYKHKRSKKKYVVAFLGVDGSGKTTTIKNLKNYLEKNKINSTLGNLGVYHERSSFMKFLGRFVKKEKNETNAQEKLNINYTRQSFFKNLIRAIDIYLRYKKTLREARKNKSKVIIFDRYSYDLILQSKMDFFTKILLKLFPKPSKLFFLYSDPKKIFLRKKERNPEVLKEQIEKFRKEIKGISKVKEIETKNEKQTLNEIIKELNNKEFLVCI